MRISCQMVQGLPLQEPTTAFFKHQFFAIGISPAHILTPTSQRTIWEIALVSIKDSKFPFTDIHTFISWLAASVGWDPLIWFGIAPGPSDTTLSWWLILHPLFSLWCLLLLTWNCLSNVLCWWDEYFLHDSDYDLHPISHWVPEVNHQQSLEQCICSHLTKLFFLWGSSQPWLCLSQIEACKVASLQLYKTKQSFSKLCIFSQFIVGSIVLLFPPLVLKWHERQLHFYFSLF